MRFYLLITTCFLCMITAAQEAQPNEKEYHHDIQFNIGVWGSAIHSNLNVASSGAGGSEAALEYRYYRTGFFGAGICLESAKVNTGELDTSLVSASGQFARAGLTFRFNLVRKPSFKLFVGTTHLLNTFDYKNENTRGNRSEINTRGFQHSLGIGCNWYFLKSFGLFSEIRWQLQSLRATSYLFNDEKQELLDYMPVENVFFSFRGLGLRLGFCFRF